MKVYTKLFTLASIATISNISFSFVRCTDFTRISYINHEQTKLISNDECNSTTYYSGSLADDSICIERQNSTTANCYVSSLINDLKFDFKNNEKNYSIWLVDRMMMVHRSCVIRTHIHRGPWKVYSVIIVDAIDTHNQMYIVNWHECYSIGLQILLAITKWF